MIGFVYHTVPFVFSKDVLLVFVKRNVTLLDLFFQFHDI